MQSQKRKPTPSLRYEETRPAEVQSRVPRRETRSLLDTSLDAQVLSEITIHDIEPGCFYIGSWRSVVLVRWESAADTAAVERLAKVSTALAIPDPRKRRSNVHFIAETAGLPSQAARAGFIELMKEHADRMASAAIVVAGTGFLASAMRSLMTGMRLLAPRSFNYRMNGSVDEVVQWLPADHLAKTGELLDARRLAIVLNHWEKGDLGGPPRPPSL